MGYPVYRKNPRYFPLRITNLLQRFGQNFGSSVIFKEYFFEKRFLEDRPYKIAEFLNPLKKKGFGFMFLIDEIHKLHNTVFNFGKYIPAIKEIRSIIEKFINKLRYSEFDLKDNVALVRDELINIIDYIIDNRI